MKCTHVSLLAGLILASLALTSPSAIAQTSTNANKPAIGQRPQPGRPGERMIAELKLTEEQSTKFKAAMAEQREKGTKIREDSSLSADQKREKAQALREESQKKIKEILTPEQFQKYEKMRSEMRRPGGPNGGKKKAE